MLRFALAQLNSHTANLDKNLNNAIHACIEAKNNHADIIIFPELFLCGYMPQDLLLEPNFIHSCQQQLEKFKQQTKHLDLHIIIGHISAKNNDIYNSAYVIYQGQELTIYHKIQLPNHGVFDEKRYFENGNLCQNSKFIDIKNIKIELAICEDIWHDKTYNQYGDILVSINASPFHLNKYAERIEKLSQYIDSKQSGIYLNMAGAQDEIVFDGSSFILDQNHQCITQLAKFKEQILYIDYDSEKKIWLNQAQKINQNFNNNNEFEDIYHALILAVKDYFIKTNFTKAVIGLSGGVDSAVTACIAVDALGKENVHTIMMPSDYTSQISLDDAQELSHNLGISHEIISISNILNMFNSSLAPSFAKLPKLPKSSRNDVTEENLQARIRGNLLMAYSNRSNALVLTTGNKSELAVGYCTLYGDMCGAFNPIKDLLKTQVYKLCDYYNKTNPARTIPARILTRAPSAELRPNQTDQDSLPPYEILDQILVSYIEHYQSAEEIIKQGIDEQIVNKILKLIKISEYKRQQGAVGPKISTRAFGKDWRYNIAYFL